MESIAPTTVMHSDLDQNESARVISATSVGVALGWVGGRRICGR
jgi:hypothetical protein